MQLKILQPSYTMLKNKIFNLKQQKQLSASLMRKSWQERCVWIRGKSERNKKRHNEHESRDFPIKGNQMNAIM